MDGHYIKSKNKPLLAAGLFLLPTLLLFWEVIAGRVLFWGTPLLQFGPWYQAAGDAVRAGELPLWNPLLGNGAPLLANYQSALFYPPNWLHLLLPPARAMSYLMLLHVLWAGVGIWLYSREIGLRSFPRLVSALCFSLSGYLVSRLGFPSIGSALPWLPWLLWAAERLSRRLTLGRGMLLGLFLGMQWLSGHAQTSFYSGLALGGYLLWRTFLPARQPNWPDIGRLAGLLLVAAATGLGLAAIQLLPTAELQQLSQRVSGVEYDFAMTYSLWPLRLIAFLTPRFFGHPATDNYWGYCCNYWEDNGYVGFLPLLLAAGAVISWIKGKRADSRSLPADRTQIANSLIPFFVLLSLLALLLAFGVHTPVYPFFFEHLPGFGQFQAPARLLCWWTLGVSLLAGIGAELWRPTGRVKKGARYGIVVGLALLLAAGGASQILSGKTLTFLVGLLQLGLSLILIGLLALRQPRPADDERHISRWAAVCLLFIAADLVSANWGANPTVEPWLYTRPTESAAALRAAELDGRTFYPSADEHAVTFACPSTLSATAGVRQRTCDRYLSFEGFGPHQTEHWFGMREALLPNTGSLDGIPSANNFDPLLPARYLDLIDAVDAASPQGQLDLLRMMGVETLITLEGRSGLTPVHVNDDVIFSAIPDPLPRAYLVFSARLAASPQEALQFITDPAFDPTRTVILEQFLSGRVPEEPMLNKPPPALPVTLTSTHNTITIRAALPQDGYLLLLDTQYPGWQVLVDDQPATIYPANLAFRAVPLSTGEHVVEFRYRPASFWIGAAVSGLTCLFGLGLLFVKQVNERRKKV
jgi:hypothetical protein